MAGWLLEHLGLSIHGFHEFYVLLEIIPSINLEHPNSCPLQCFCRYDGMGPYLGLSRASYHPNLNFYLLGLVVKLFY